MTERKPRLVRTINEVLREYVGTGDKPSHRKRHRHQAQSERVERRAQPVPNHERLLALTCQPEPKGYPHQSADQNERERELGLTKVSGEAFHDTRILRAGQGGYGRLVVRVHRAVAAPPSHLCANYAAGWLTRLNVPVITTPGGETNGRNAFAKLPRPQTPMAQSEFNMSRRVTAVAVFACAIASVGACGEEPPTLDAFCDEAAQGVCKLLFNPVCLDTELGGLTPRYANEAACAGEEAKLCKADGAAQNIYDGTEAMACLTSIETATCRNAARGAFPGCEKVWDGLAPPIRPVDDGDTGDGDTSDTAESGE